MFKNASFYAICTLFIFLSSCVSKDKYMELESSLRNTETQLNDRNEAHYNTLRARWSEPHWLDSHWAEIRMLPGWLN